MSYGIFGALDLPLGLGLLRLGTEGRPDQATAISLIHAALDGGVRVLDTADSYCLDERDLHYGERLARRAVASWSGDASAVKIITKVGMARPKGRWSPAAEPERLRKVVEGSRQALEVDRIFLLLLHVNDPGVPFEDQLSALAALQREGKVEHLGLCNVDVAEIRQAERHFRVAAIQNELSVANRKSATEGTLALARQQGIVFLAHRPLGGHAKTEALEKNRAMKPVSERHGITRHEAALATLLDLGAPVVPLVGVTRPESLASSLRAARVRLSPEDRGKISFDPTPEALAWIAPAPPTPSPGLSSGEGPREAPEVVIVMGIQGAGKSSLVGRYADAGYDRLNRDLLGGRLDDLVPALEKLLASGKKRVILDNTYPTRASRWPVIRAAHAAGVPVRCIHLATPHREAMINVVNRVLDRYAKLPSPDDLKQWARTDPNLPPPEALARWMACFEPPAADEGFGAVEVVPFVRRPSGHQVRGLLLDVDGTLRVTRSGENYPRDPADIELLPGRAEVLRRAVDEGWRLFFVSNQSGVASEKVTEEAVRRCFERTIELLGVPVTEVAFCPHTSFPAGCYCRKPLPGLGVDLARRHQLDLSESLMVGDLKSDLGFATALGVRFVEAREFFGA